MAMAPAARIACGMRPMFVARLGDRSTTYVNSAEVTIQPTVPHMRVRGYVCSRSIRWENASELVSDCVGAYAIEKQIMMIRNVEKVVDDALRNSSVPAMQCSRANARSAFR
jgi:hypothetical protein